MTDENHTEDPFEKIRRYIEEQSKMPHVATNIAARPISWPGFARKKTPPPAPSVAAPPAPAPEAPAEDAADPAVPAAAAEPEASGQGDGVAPQADDVADGAADGEEVPSGE